MTSLTLLLPRGLAASGALMQATDLADPLRASLEHPRIVARAGDVATSGQDVKAAKAAACAALPPCLEMVEKGDNGEGTESGKRMMDGIAMFVLPLSVIGAVWSLLLFDNALVSRAMPGSFCCSPSG